jgi:hypothetical protein
MLHRAFGKRSLAVVDGIHQINPTPGRIHLFTNHPVTRTGGKAKPTVNAGIYQFLLWGMIGIKTGAGNSRRGFSVNGVFL